MKQYINTEHKLSTFENLSEGEKVKIIETDCRLSLTVRNIIKNLESLEEKINISDSVRGYYINRGKLFDVCISKAQIKADLDYFANLQNTLTQSKNHYSDFDHSTIRDLQELISDFKFVHCRINAINVSQENIKELRLNILVHTGNKAIDAIEGGYKEADEVMKLVGYVYSIHRLLQQYSK
jgi:hypothetical protein